MRLVVWLLRAFIFFTLFAFALNNQHLAQVRWFFGAQWQAPMVIVVLVAFACGAAVGVMAMLPGWWQRLRRKRRQTSVPVAVPPPPEPSSLMPSEFGPEQPQRLGP